MISVTRRKPTVTNASEHVDMENFASAPCDAKVICCVKQRRICSHFQQSSKISAQLIASRCSFKKQFFLAVLFTALIVRAFVLKRSIVKRKKNAFRRAFRCDSGSAGLQNSFTYLELQRNEELFVRTRSKAETAPRT